MNRNVALVWILGALLAMAGAFVFFHDLGQFPIFQWDEARYANNSVEMLLDGHWLNYRFNGEIDQWNFKPPLVLWLQALSMKVFGMTEFGVRFPSALAGTGLMALLFWFCATVLRSLRAAVITGLFFLASPGFIGPHMGRTADLDAVQTFFVTLYTLLFIRYLLEDRPPVKTFATLGVLVVLSFLCKGMPGLLLLPFLFIISLLNGNYQKVFRYRAVYISAALALLACAGYYVLREMNSPGYWELLKKSEFNRFSGVGVAWHKHPASFYFQNFTELKRYPLIWALPLTLTAFFTAQSQKTRRFFGYCTVIVAGYLAFISWPPVKLEWYDAPLYPFFALMFGVAVSEGAEWIEKWQKRRLAWGIALIAAAACCQYPYRLVWEKIQYSPDKMADFEREGVFIKQLQAAHPDWLNFTMLKSVKHPEHLDQLRFYQKTFQARFGVPLAVATDFKSLQSGGQVLVAQPAQIDSVFRHFPGAEVLFQTDYGRLIQLK